VFCLRWKCCWGLDMEDERLAGTCEGLYTTIRMTGVASFVAVQVWLESSKERDSPLIFVRRLRHVKTVGRCCLHTMMRFHSRRVVFNVIEEPCIQCQIMKLTWWHRHGRSQYKNPSFLLPRSTLVLCLLLTVLLIFLNRYVVLYKHFASVYRILRFSRRYYQNTHWVSHANTDAAALPCTSPCTYIHQLTSRDGETRPSY